MWQPGCLQKWRRSRKSGLGRVAEWFKAAVLKTAEGASLPWVRIPPRPPEPLQRPFKYELFVLAPLPFHKWFYKTNEQFFGPGLRATMRVPNQSLNLTKAEAARRQVDAAIRALQAGDLDIAITLAGAAEQMFARDGMHIFKFMLEAPVVQGIDRKEWIASLNADRDWLKHVTPNDAISREFSVASAAVMIARAASKLDAWTPLMDEFRLWLLANDQIFD